MVVEGEGEVYRYRNDRTVPRDALYASVTAREVQRVEVWVDDDLLDVVYAGAGGSHSWWAQAGGKILPARDTKSGRHPGGLLPDETLRIVSDGPIAFRIDWNE